MPNLSSRCTAFSACARRAFWSRLRYSGEGMSFTTRRTMAPSRSTEPRASASSVCSSPAPRPLALMGPRENMGRTGRRTNSFLPLSRSTSM
ncbi:MAG: hypothetical protein A4E29_00966 [Methanomassiliicoccales archaeon PtaB.Bin134]|nr:MAG: hypothetical protein A4E29_00966 [Methanomassiliicoccales archaeon PtaB.Bin134]